MSARKLPEGPCPFWSVLQKSLRFTPYAPHPSTSDITVRPQTPERFLGRHVSSPEKLRPERKLPEGSGQAFLMHTSLLVPCPRLAWYTGGAHSGLQVGVRILAVTSFRGEATGVDFVLLALPAFGAVREKSRTGQGDCAASGRPQCDISSSAAYAPCSRHEACAWGFGAEPRTLPLRPQ